MRLNPCLVGMEYKTRWTAYTLRIPVSFFNRAGRPSHITAWRVSDGGSGHRTPSMPSLASMSPSLKRASLKPYMSSLMAVPVQASRADGRFPCDLDLASSISAPESWGNTNNASKDSGKMALLGKAGHQCNLCQRNVSLQQKLLSPINSKVHLPLMRGESRGL